MLTIVSRPKGLGRTRKMDATQENVDLSVLLHNLSNSGNDDEVLKALMDLNMVVDANKYSREQLSKVNLSHFFTQIHSLTGKSKKVAISLVGKVFSCLDPVDTVEKYVEDFTESLGTESEDMKIVYLTLLEKVSCSIEGVEFLQQNLHTSQRPLLALVAENVAHNSIGVAKLAASVIRNACISSKSFLTEEFLAVFLRHLDRGSVIRFRVYDLFVGIFSSANEILDNANVVTIFEKLISEMSMDDILAQLNCLEMLSNMACQSAAGLQFISSSGTLERVNNIFKLAESDPLQGLLVPGAVKFFGSIAIKRPFEILENYQQFLHFVFANLESEDPSLVALCFETIANICTTDDGIKILCSDQKRMNNAMKIAGKYMQSSVDESIKVRFFEALSLVFQNDSTLISTSSTKEKLYRNITQNPLQFLMETAKTPFPAVRCSSLAVLSHLALYSWVEEDMALTPGFVEYLLDRKTEPDKQGKEIKFKIIKNLSMSKSAKDNLGIGYYKRICQYVQEGPFRSEQETAVDFEQAN